MLMKYWGLKILKIGGNLENYPKINKLCGCATCSQVKPGSDPSSSSSRNPIIEMPKRIGVSRLGASLGKGWRPAAPLATSPTASGRMTAAVQRKMCRRGSPPPVILTYRRRPEAGIWRSATSAERSPRRGRIGYSTGCVHPASVPSSTASSSSPSPRTP